MCVNVCGTVSLENIPCNPCWAESWVDGCEVVKFTDLMKAEAQNGLIIISGIVKISDMKRNVPDVLKAITKISLFQREFLRKLFSCLLHR